MSALSNTKGTKVKLVITDDPESFDPESGRAIDWAVESENGGGPGLIITLDDGTEIVHALSPTDALELALGTLTLVGLQGAVDSEKIGEIIPDLLSACLVARAINETGENIRLVECDEDDSDEEIRAQMREMAPEMPDEMIDDLLANLRANGIAGTMVNSETGETTMIDTKGKRKGNRKARHVFH